MSETGMLPVAGELHIPRSGESAQCAESASKRDVVTCDSVKPNQRQPRKRARSMAGRCQLGSVRLKSRTWYGRFRKDFPEGRQQVSVILGYKPEMRTKAQAQAKLQQMLVAEGVNEPDYLDRVLKPAVTFNDVADQWELKRLPELSASSQNTVPFRLRKFIRPFFGTMPLASIRTAQVNDWIRSLTARGLKPKTVHNTYKDFRGIVNWHRQ